MAIKAGNCKTIRHPCDIVADFEGAFFGRCMAEVTAAVHLIRLLHKEREQSAEDMLGFAEILIAGRGVPVDTLEKELF